MRLITWNINSVRLHLPIVLQLLEQAKPDVLCLQEIKTVNETFPTEALAEECADLLILLIGTSIAGNFKLDDAFWAKMGTLAQRKSRIVDGRIRVSEFRNE